MTISVEWILLELGQPQLHVTVGRAQFPEANSPFNYATRVFENYLLRVY